MPPKRRIAKSTKKPVRIGPLKKGTLRQFGYGLYKSAAIRHAALVKGVKMLGYATIIRKLTAIAVLNKNRAPAASKVYRSDMAYLRGKFRGGSDGGALPSVFTARTFLHTPY